MGVPKRLDDMHVSRLQVHNFRKLHHVDLELHPGFNLFLGDNAAGKTSLLETLYVAAYGRPFTGLFEDALGPAADLWKVVVSGREQFDRPLDQIEVAFLSKRREQKINGQTRTAAELARLLPIALLEPRSHALMADGPSQRRRYLDWGLFHVEHGFLDVWRRYRRALRQRNNLLRLGADSAQLRPWTAELIQCGEKLHQSRQRQLDRVRKDLLSNLDFLVGAGPWTIDLDSGWGDGSRLSDVLLRNELADRKVGQTMKGPHRAEIIFSRAGIPLRRRVSRGEEKLAVAALLFAQVAAIRRLSAGSVMLLVDDFTSEMGETAQRHLLDALVELQEQVVMTSLGLSAPLASVRDCTMFHVEHGAVTAVVD